jgi:tetratricopeptide (TPR) repeat protein
MGALAVTRGEWTEAADWLEVAIAPPAQLTRAYRLLSTVYRKLGRESAARYISEKADKLGRQSDPYDPWWDETHQYCFDSYRLTVFADKRVAEGKLEEARQILRRAMEIDPQNARAHFDLAMLSGDNPWATSNRILLLEKAIERDPKFTDAYLELALALTNSEQIPTALEIIAQGLQHQPKAPGLHRMRGRIMQREKKYREAQQSLERGIALNVNDPDGYIALGNFHWARGDKRTAAAQYTRATELSMLVIEPRAMLATYLIEQGEFDRAIAQLESTQFLVTEVEGLTELHALAYLRKGNAALHGQNFIIGEAALKRALEIDPSSTEAFNNLCNFYLTADRLKAAQILSDSFLQHNPADLFGYQLAAGVEMKRGHPRAAIAILQRGVEQAKSQGQTPTRRELELLIDTIERGSSG